MKTEHKRDITIKLSGNEAYWINRALEVLRNNFSDDYDAEEVEEIAALENEFYRQWYPQDSGIPETWLKPKA